MSILIKNMTMPTCCDECWALDDYGDYPVCRITQEQRGYNFNVRERRMDKCPLEAESVKHGRWIFNPKDAIEMMFILPKCSECGAESSDGGNYCPNCGADMRPQEKVHYIPVPEWLKGVGEE